MLDNSFFLGATSGTSGIIATGLVLVAVLALMVAGYTSVTLSDPMSRRIKALNARRDELKAGLISQGSPKRRRLARGNDTTDRMKDLLQTMKVLQESQIRAIQQKLVHAGFRDKDLAVIVIFGRMVIPAVLGIIAFIALYGAELFPDWSDFKRFMAFAAAMMIGYKAPEIYLKNLATKRMAAIQKGLPDALDLLVICAEAGLTIDAAFGRVAKELDRAFPELGEEFTLTAIELSFLTERRQAFENLAYRVGLDAVRGVVTTMIQTERYGTPLASALRVLSAEFRNQRMMRAEEKAARLPAIMTVPLILFILPVLFIVILGPASCSIADAFSSDGAASAG